MAEKRSVRDIIDDWALSVWRVERPNTYARRFDAYLRLFDTFVMEGYGPDDVTSADERYILDRHTVSKTRGTAGDRAKWSKAAQGHMWEARKKAFKLIGKIADSRGEDARPEPKTPPAPANSAEPDIAEVSKNKKLREFVPDPAELETIRKNFKFEGTDDDLL